MLGLYSVLFGKYGPIVCRMNPRGSGFYTMNESCTCLRFNKRFFVKLFLACTHGVNTIVADVVCAEHDCSNLRQRSMVVGFRLLLGRLFRRVHNHIRQFNTRIIRNRIHDIRPL